MYDQIREDTLFIILYSVVTAMAMMASCYLLFRQGNAFAKDVTAASTSASLDCSLLCCLSPESCGVYADLLSLFKRGYYDD